MSSPLHDYREDAAVIEAGQAKAAHAELVAAIRDDPDRSETARVRDVAATDDTVNAKLDQASADLQQRRQSRHAALERRLPLGPEIPADSSPADTAVLHQLHRGATATAAAMSGPERVAALRRAVRDGDTVMERAVTAVALEDGDHETLGALAQGRPDSGLADVLTELSDLRRKITGGDITDGVRRAQTFRHVGDKALADWHRSTRSGPLGSGMPSETRGSTPLTEGIRGKIAASGVLDRPA